MSILSPWRNWLAGRDLIYILRRHRQLTWELTRRELTDRYAGQMLGILWAFVHPAILIGVYVFIFVCVFAVKIGGTHEMPRDYTTYLLAGLIPWLTCSEAMNKGATVLTGNANLVKQVVFPLEVLPVKSVLASLLTQLISSGLLIVYMYFALHAVPWTIALLPLLLVVQVLGLIGICCVLASIGAYFRDVKEFVQIFSVVGIYLMPIVYLPSMVPAMFQPLLYFNPFSYLAWCYQDVFYFGRLDHPLAWVVFPALSLIVFALGYRVFRKLKPMLGNVL
jgi:lipopolysaccharide transport system permease protein